MDQPAFGDCHACADDLLPSLEHVSAVRVERAPRGFHQQQSCAARETTEVLDVWKMGDQKGVGVEAGKTKPEPIYSAPA
jgi:hypothetical protein